MSIINRARELASNAFGQGQQRIDRIRVDRRRSELLTELGESCYAQSKGVATSAAEIERIIGEIDDLADDGTDVPAPAPTDGADDESAPSESSTT
jgi:hypothetical protein